MQFYRDSNGNIAKLLETDSHIIVMFSWSTKFFQSSKEAYIFLIQNGFTFQGHMPLLFCVYRSRGF